MVHVAGVRVAADYIRDARTAERHWRTSDGDVGKMVSVPVAAPSAVGVNTTLMVQVAPAAKVVVQVPPPDREKSVDEKVSVMPVPAAVPVLCSVRVRAAVAKPMPALPKASGPPVTLSTATGGVEPNSTAPGSK